MTMDVGKGFLDDAEMAVSISSGSRAKFGGNSKAGYGIRWRFRQGCVTDDAGFLVSETVLQEFVGLYKERFLMRQEQMSSK
jgi:hypothetical protein